MATILIHTAKPEESRVHLGEHGRATSRSVPFKQGTRGDVLATLDALLKAKKKYIASLEGIIVVTGPGHFSCLRTGIAIANTIGFALDIPVVGIEADDQMADKELFERGIKLLARKKKFTSVAPAYGKEPTITKPKDI